jgi:ubiquinone/menaquinone biosynthesis C-methylase UbiE
MPVFDHFDLLAPIYDRFIKPTDLDRFCNIAGLPITGRLLDAGGGTGQKSHRLIDMVDEVVVADASLGMLSQANKKNGLHVVCSQTEQLPFEGGTFERVIMVDALHHVYNQRLTANELWRVVKAGGRIVIEEPDIRAAAVKAIAIIENLALMRSHFMNPQRIAAIFNNPQAVVKIKLENSISWIIIDKQAS